MTIALTQYKTRSYVKYTVSLKKINYYTAIRLSAYYLTFIGTSVLKNIGNFTFSNTDTSLVCSVL